MDLAADLPVTLVVKAANQRVADQTVECVLGWTIRKLKQHLESVYPSKPKHHQQKLIYSGQLLADHLTLKEVLRQYDEQNSRHTVHLVCSPSVEILSHPGTSQSPSPSEKKSEQHASTSQSSVSSSESDGLRHRGAQASGSTPSSSEVPNTGVNPAMAVPGAAAMGGMPGMAGMGGMPMMGPVAPGMGMAGYSYTPEQMAWMQQMYSQYMAQYMQYYGYQAPAAPDPVNPVQAPEPQPAANQAPVNNAPANQNMRMNAQGGLEEDDEEEQRDWLDYIYVFFRFLVLVGIVYFYSSFSRFFTVAIGSLIIYLIQNGWLILNRRQQQQRQQQEAQQPPAQPQQQQQQQQQPQQQQPQQQQPEQQQQHNQAEGNQTERQNEDARQAGTEEGREQEAGQATTSDSQQQASSPQPEVPSTPAVLLRMLVSFFTSLVPTQPPAVNGN